MADELSRLSAGDFDSDKLDEKAVTARLGELNGQTATLQARIAKALPKLDEHFCLVRGSKLRLAALLNARNDAARVVAAAEIQAALQPLFGDHWNARIAEDFTGKFGRDINAQREIEERAERAEGLRRFDPRAENDPLPRRDGARVAGSQCCRAP